MRGRVDRQGAVFHTFDVHALVPAGHPLREVKRRADELEKQQVTPLVPMPAGPIRGPEAAARRRAKQGMKTALYRTGQRIRKRVEEIIGWCEDIGGLRRARFVGRWKIALQAMTTGAACNLIRLARLKPLAA